MGKVISRPGKAVSLRGDCGSAGRYALWFSASPAQQRSVPRSTVLVAGERRECERGKRGRGIEGPRV